MTHNPHKPRPTDKVAVVGLVLTTIGVNYGVPAAPRTMAIVCMTPLLVLVSVFASCRSRSVRTWC